MCCFCLHFSDFNVLFFQNNKKTCCSLLLKKKLVVQKEGKNNLSQGKIPAPPWISNGPSLTASQKRKIIFTVPYPGTMDNKKTRLMITSPIIE